MDLSNWGSLYEIDAVGLYGRPCHKPKTGGLSGNLKKLLKNPIYNDLTFEVDGKEVPAHKAIVCSRSEVFETMFSIGMKESTINRFPIKGIRYEIFLLLIEFIYTENIEKLDQNQIIELYLAANQWAIKDLESFMIEKFRECLEVDNVLSIYFDQVIKFKALGLRSSCYDFIADYPEIFEQKEVGNFEKEEMMEIFTRIAKLAKK
jgi:kelch-like protein 7